MPSHIVRSSVQIGARTIAGEATLTGGLSKSIDEAAPGVETSTPMTLTLDVSAVKSLYMLSDQDAAVEFAHSGGPTQIDLTADKPFQWFTGCGHDFPISADVTSVIVTVLGADTARFQLEAIIDATP